MPALSDICNLSPERGESMFHKSFAVWKRWFAKRFATTSWWETLNGGQQEVFLRALWRAGFNSKQAVNLIESLSDSFTDSMTLTAHRAQAAVLPGLN